MATSMVGVEVKTRWGHVSCLKAKSASGCLAALQQMVADMSALSKGGPKVVVRVHSDDGTEFKGVFDDYCASKNWKRTNTGGYREQSNGI